MNKLKKLLPVFILSFTILALPAGADASTYKVQEGDTFWTIAKNFSISLTNLQIANQQSGNLIYEGETIYIPDSVSYENKKLLAKLVHAEAKGEPYAGKVAVATVVLNRVNHKEFPDSVKGVVYKKVQGTYAFTPVKNGAINQGYTAEDMRAVNEAVAFRGQGGNSIYFYNPETASSDWIFTREVTKTIGNHRFAK
ncbi:cell wall hydrolase [Virgibacillus kekensis]|uniref:Cell wall hydrolase n=1 Tax=Virgibacillus kekensis TaxID=202261 RepID=A0ABV9DNY2_9BACI